MEDDLRIPLRYTWVEAPSDGALTLEAIPLLRPDDENRALRWSEILDWYGIRAGDLAVVDTVRSKPFEGRDEIVSIDPECDELARWYASVMRRPFLRAESLEACLAFHSRITPTLTVIGRRDSFPLRMVSKMLATLEVPVGVITAIDLPGVSFLLAKQIGLLASSADRIRPYVVLDEIGERICIGDLVSGKTTRNSYDRSMLRSVLADGWDTMILHAHGEGGHVNLRDAVLCGRVTEVETSTNGEQVFGCFREHGLDRCKRVHNASVSIAVFGDVRSKRVCLYSCNGFAVTGELYPSNVSCVLSAADGYPASMMCNDRPGHASASMLDAAVCAMRQVGMSGLISLENDRQRRADGDSPWLMLGDAAVAGARDGLALGGALVDGRVDPLIGYVILERAKCDKRTVLYMAGATRDEAGASSAKLLVGDTTITAHVPTAADMERSLAFMEIGIDVDERLNSVEEWISGLGRIADYEFNLGLAPLSARRDPLAYECSINDLSDARARLDSSLRLALRLLQSAKVKGVYDEQVESAWLVARDFVNNWDSTFAALLFNHYVNDDIEALAMGGASLDWHQAQDICPRCRSPLKCAAGQSALHPGRQRFALRCGACGPISTWFDLGPKLEVTLPSEIRRGDNVAARVVIAEEVKSPHLMPGYLSLVFRDKGRGEMVVSEMTEMSAHTVELAIKIDESMTFDLHSLRLVLVRSLKFCSYRSRLACVP